MTSTLRPAGVPLGAQAVRRGERGFTLPELMVAMTITLLVSAAALTALQNANRASQAGAVLTDVNQNLRVAMNLVIRDLLQTGALIPTGGVPLPRGEGATPIIRPAPPGFQPAFPAAWDTLPAASPGNALGPTVNGIVTDMVSVIYADQRLDLTRDAAGNAVFVTVATDGSSVVFPAGMSIGDPAIGVQEGDLFLFSNPLGFAIQEVTSVSGQSVFFAAVSPSNLNQRTAPQGSVLALRNADATWPPTSVRRITMVSYYVLVPTSGPISGPHFIRRVNWGDERVVAVGIENFQLTWDLVDGITNPTNVESPESPYSPNQVRKANLYMAARAVEESAGAEHLRSSLTTQVSLRSLAFVSRYDIQ